MFFFSRLFNLWDGTMWESFQIFGTTPDDKDELEIAATCWANRCANSFKMRPRILSGPHVLKGLVATIFSQTSNGSILGIWSRAGKYVCKVVISCGGMSIFTDIWYFSSYWLILNRTIICHPSQKRIFRLSEIVTTFDHRLSQDVELYSYNILSFLMLFQSEPCTLISSIGAPVHCEKTFGVR